MSSGEIVLTVVLGVVSIEFSEVAPWLARRIARWAAIQRYRDRPDRVVVRVQEWVSVVEERPGKLFKLVTALWFAGGAVAGWSWQGVHRRRYRLRRIFSPVPSEPLFMWGFVPFTLPSVSIDNPTLALAIGIGLSVTMLSAAAFARNRELRRLLPKLIAEDIVSATEVEGMLALFPVRWWQVRARWKVPREARSAAGALKSALLSIATFRSLFSLPSVTEETASPLGRRMRRQSREVAEARIWFSQVAALAPQKK